MRNLYVRLKKVDARWFLFGSHFILVCTGFFFYQLQRSWFQLLSGIGTAIALEFALAYWTNKFVEFRWADRLLSALAMVFGLMLLVHSREPYYYAFGSMIAMAAKYFLRRPDGRHMFNPTNFAIVFSYAVLPLGSLTGYPDEYSLHIGPYISVIACGLLAVGLSGRWVVTLAYFIGNFAIAAVLAPFFHMPFYYLVAPDVGIIGLIFMFLMITDPQTTPKGRMGMVVFGFAVAFFNIMLRNYEIIFSYFISLFMVVCLYQLSWLVPWSRLRARANTEPMAAGPSERRAG